MVACYGIIRLYFAKRRRALRYYRYHFPPPLSSRAKRPTIFHTVFNTQCQKCTTVCSRKMVALTVFIIMKKIIQKKILESIPSTFEKDSKFSSRSNEKKKKKKESLLRLNFLSVLKLE